jgi:hypothetical protein
MAKRKTKKKKETKEDFFVALNNPNLIRMPILEARKNTLESMRLFKEIKELRKKKIAEKTNLRKQVRQISSLLSKIKSSLPHVKLPAQKEVKETLKEIEDTKPEQSPKEVEKPKTEIDRIEAELADIESKLSNL